MKLALLGVAGLLFSTLAVAEEPLFVIARSTNANVVHYVANMTPDGLLDPTDPISAYWIMSAEDGHRESLTWLERHHAYGFDVQLDSGNKSLTLKIKALDNRPIRIRVFGGTPRAEVEISGHPAFLQSVFVQASGGFFPGVDTLALSGLEVDTGEKLKEVIRP